MNNTHTPSKRQLADDIERNVDIDYIHFLTSLCDDEVERILSCTETTNSPQPPPLKRQRPFHSRTDALIHVLNEEYTCELE